MLGDNIFMKLWFTVNQQTYEQFIFFIKAASKEEAQDIYSNLSIPIKCKFHGGVIIKDKDKEHQVIIPTIKIEANSVVEAQTIIENKLQEKFNNSVIHIHGILKIKVK